MALLFFLHFPDYSYLHFSPHILTRTSLRFINLISKHTFLLCSLSNFWIYFLNFLNLNCRSTSSFHSPYFLSPISLYFPSAPYYSMFCLLSFSISWRYLTLHFRTLLSLFDFSLYLSVLPLHAFWYISPLALYFLSLISNSTFHL